MAIGGLSREWLEQRLAGRRALPDDPAIPRFMHPPGCSPVAAAVLVPILDRVQGPTLLFTQRSPHLHDHAGQISFPGGRVDACDTDRVATALREIEEETGVPHQSVKIIGQLPEYDIMTGFRVTPVVGWVQPPAKFNPDPFEVTEVFEVPLSYFLDPAHHERHTCVINGVTRHFYAMPFGERYIWGATAGMLYSLYQVLAPDR